MVLQRRDGVGALHVTADEVTARRFVEWSLPVVTGAARSRQNSSSHHSIDAPRPSPTFDW